MRFVRTGKREWAWLLVLAGFICVPLLCSSPYALHVITLFFIYVMLAMGLSIIVGYAGLLVIGYAAFFAVGAYFYAVLNTRAGLPFEIAVLGAALMAALVGIVLGFPTLRVRGDYLALVTLAFGEIATQVLNNWTSITGGPKGIPAVSSPEVFAWHAAGPGQQFYLALACTSLGFLIMRQVSRSPFAVIWESIRDDELAARACGVNTTNWLLLAFALGAAFAGAAGALFAGIQRFVSPESFTLSESILILSIVVLAGGKSVSRIMVAGCVLFCIPEAMRSLSEYRTLAFGLILIVFTVLDHSFSKRRSRARGTALEEDLRPHYESGKRFPPCLRAAKGPVSEIKLTDVSKSFSGLHALQGVTFTVPCEKGIVGLIGPNGAGKTTLFNCIAGLLSPDQGTIEACGLGDLTKKTDHETAKLGVGRTFQRTRLFQSMTVRENVFLGAFCNQRIPYLASVIPGASMRRFQTQCSIIAHAAMDFLGIDGFADGKVSSLPIGVQRKVEIARTLAMRPRLLLFDEVASGLNEAEKKELADLLRTMSSEGGIPIILVEHDIAFVTQLSKHISVLAEGRLLAEGSPDEILADERVIASYLGTRRC